MIVNKVFSTLFITSFIFWNAFNPGFLPLSLYFSLIIFLMNLKSLSLRILLRPIQGIFLFHSLLITPILVIYCNNAINLNHLIAEIYIFVILVGASYFSYKHIKNNNYKIIFTYVYVLFVLLVLIEWYMGTQGVYLNQLLGFKTNSPAGGGIYYRAFGFFPEPSDLAIANTFLFVLFFYHDTSYARRFILILFFVFITIITRSATMFALISILICISFSLSLFRKSSIKNLFKYGLLLLVLSYFLYSYQITNEIINVVVDKITFDPQNRSAFARKERYQYFSQIFLDSSFVEYMFGRGTGYLSMNDDSLLSWFFTLILEKGLIFIFIFLFILGYIIFLNIYRNKTLTLENALLLIALLPLFVQTGFYFPFFGFSLGVFIYRTRGN